MNLICKRGDTLTFAINNRDSVGNPVDITDYTYFSTLKRSLDDADEDAASAVETGPGDHDNPAQGASHVTHLAASTDSLLGQYHYDVQEVDGDGNVTTIASGIVTFTKDATRRVVAP